MKMFTGMLSTETNTFAPYPTGLATFREGAFLRRGEVAPDPRQDMCGIFVRQAQKAGWDVALGLRASAQPAGRVPRAVYEALRDELVSDLRAALPVDVVLLQLHGAMVAEGCDDCEGDILRRVRELVGPGVPVGAELDPHCHLTGEMVEHATLLHIYKEYPHTDVAARGRELFQMIADTHAGRIDPTPALHDPRMIAICHTTKQPMRSFVDSLFELEGRDGVLAVSIGHGFPWGDVPALGSKVLVYTDGDPDGARKLAESLGQQLHALRAELGPAYGTVDSVLDAALAQAGGPLVIADSPDNPGGGAPGDSTYLLRGLLERGAGEFALGYLFDPGAVRIACEAGEGATLDLRIGGKVCALSGEPVDLRVRVTRVLEEATQDFARGRFEVGTAVALDAGQGRELVLISLRVQTYARNLFEALGVDLAAKRVIAVKSSQHFHASFAELAKRVLYLGAPGVVASDFTSLPYEKADLGIWPFRP